MTLQDHLGAKASLPKNGPDTGAEVEKAMTAGLGPETDGLGAGSCLSGRQTTVSFVFSDFLFFSRLRDSWLQFLTLFCRHDSVYCDSFSHSSAVVF